MAPPRTISATVAQAIPLPEAVAVKSKTTAAIIHALEERERALIHVLQNEIDGIEEGAIDLYATAQERGFLGT